ncbi:MAG TPA: exosortase/archaeosortase family protein [Tepidisphaeraceae bacterium]|nr:exosortase/archaeosortase family protein [Tepidisphaeraceae bacterium]
MAAALLIASNAWADIVHLAWYDEESSHVLLVPVIMAWLIWERRHRIKNIQPSPSLAGAAIFALGWTSWSLGYRYQVQICWHGGAILMLLGAVVTAIGMDIVTAFLPAVAVMVFLIPIPATGRQLISVPLQRVTATITQNVGEILGIDIQRSGSILSLNNHETAVAEACNGMRMVFTLFLACYAVAFISPLRYGVRFLVLALSPVTAVVANVVRLVPTVWVFANYPQAEAETFHTATGWAMLILAFGALTGIIRLLRWADVPVMQPPRPPRAMVGQRHSAALKKWEPALAIVTMLLLVSGASADRLSLPTPRSAEPYHALVRLAAAKAPMRIGVWVGQNASVEPEVYESLKPNVFISRRYTNSNTGEWVSFLLVQCADVRDLAPHYPPACYPGAGLSLTASRDRDWQIGGLHIEGREYEFESNQFLHNDPIIVENFMLLPDGRTGRDNQFLRRQIGLADRYFGAAQVQIVFPAETPLQRRDEIFQTIVGAYAPLLKTIGSGSLDRSKPPTTVHEGGSQQ